MKNKNIFKFIFLLVVLFFFSLDISAASTKRCVYEHPDEPQCTLELNKGENGWGYVPKLIMDATYGPCIADEDVWDISPNTYHYRGDKGNDKRFFKLFGEKYDEVGGCPDIYIGTKKYKCNVKNSEAEGASSDYYCFFAYLENNKNGTRIKVEGERKTADTLEDLNDQYMAERKKE